ncbi:hypothetical protein V2J09_022166 [Rumex salicifolius]
MAFQLRTDSSKKEYKLHQIVWHVILSKKTLFTFYFSVRKQHRQSSQLIKKHVDTSKLMSTSFTTLEILLITPRVSSLSKSQNGEKKWTNDINDDPLTAIVTKTKNQRKHK